MTMSQKDYYKILGVSRNESPEGIRSAFRRLAKKYHPDKAGPEAKDRFQDVQEAYEVLSHPQKRTSYDRKLDFQERGFHSARRSPIYDANFGGSSLFSEFFGRRATSGKWPNYGYESRPYRSSRPQPDMILVLSRKEAREGGSVEARVPFYSPCPYCGGSGEDWFFPCMHCFGEGLVRQTKRVRFHIPVGIQDGTIIEVPLQTVGNLKRYLTVLVEVR